MSSRSIGRQFHEWADAVWFAEVDSHIYAVLRVLFGVLGCLSLIGLFDLPLFWSCEGLSASRDNAACQYLVSVGLGWTFGYSLLLLSMASFVTMAVGYHTRFSIGCAFGSVFFIAAWNALPLSSAHQVLRCILFCLFWADCGRVWSADAWLARRRAVSEADEGPTAIWPLQLIRIQVAVIYLVTGLWKLDNVTWRDGSALHYVLLNNQFRRFAFTPSPDWDSWTTAATYATLAWEIGFAFLVLHPRTRRWALIAGIVIHAGMWATLELGPFSWVMLASYVAFLDPEYVRTRLTAAKAAEAAKAETTE